MSKDDRPYFHDQLGIPWDEFQVAAVIMARHVGVLSTPTSSEIDEIAARLARRASQRLRKGK